MLTWSTINSWDVTAMSNLFGDSLELLGNALYTLFSLIITFATNNIVTIITVIWLVMIGYISVWVIKNKLLWGSTHGVNLR